MRRLAVFVGVATAVAAAGACLPGAGPPLSMYMDDAGPPPTTSLDIDSGAATFDVDLGASFALLGLTPSHGPWTGGTRAVMRGRGFPSALRVTIGGVALSSAQILASDPTTAAITTPAGSPGPADVMIRDDTTAQEYVLPAGFFYDAFVVQPDSGSTTGGTRVTLVGEGTSFASGATVAVDGKPCLAVTVVDPTHLQCTTPADAPGTKDVAITNADGSTILAREAYTYDDSVDGYRGGLSGGTLAGNLQVLALDDWTGDPLPGAYVIAGALQARTNAAGVASFADPTLATKVTVTVAAKCHQPMTFVDVPVDTVTAYINPQVNTTCAMGDPPSVGNYTGVDGGQIAGELVWPGVEFKRGMWTNVPGPVRPTERQAAYVFFATGSPTDGFQLPPASAAITPSSPGTLGYAYLVGSAPGNVTMYALAGIEDRSVNPPRFEAYAMGVARGVSVSPSTQTEGVDIQMTSILDHVVTLAPSPPAPAPRGPDRFQAALAVTLGLGRFAILPTSSEVVPLPVSGDVRIVGVPGLDEALAGEQYAITAAAVTGPNLALPASIVAGVRTTDANDALSLGGFLGVPVLVAPSQGAAWNGTSVEIGAGGPIDLLRLDVSSGAGLVTWTIVGPGATTSYALPDLSLLPDSVGLVRGPITTTAWVAAMPNFSYGSLRYGQLGSGAWSSYAFDAATGSY